MKGLLMVRVVWLRWSFVLIALSGSFKIYGALPLQEDKPAEPKDFATKYSKRLAHPPTQPVELFNSKEEYICSFNALMQVLWILEPLNSALKFTRTDNSILKTYLASIDAKNTWSGPLFLKPFIDRINPKNKITDTDEVLGAFMLTLPDDVYELFNIHYNEYTYCPNKKIGSVHSVHTDDKILPDSTYVLRRTITEKSNDLQRVLDRPQEQVDECICPKHQVKQHLVTSLIPIPPLPSILVIYTNRRQDLTSTKKVKIPYTFPLLNLKFGETLYDLVGVIFHAGETADKGHYYAWVEQNGIWYRCNDTHKDPEHPENDPSLGTMSFKTIADTFKETQDAHFVQPLSETNLLVYLKKPLHLAQLMQSSFAQATLQKKQLAVARDVWQQKEAFIDQRIKNFGATIEKNLKKQWEPVFQGMLDA